MPAHAARKVRLPILTTYCSDCRKTVRQKNIDTDTCTIDLHDKCPKCKGLNIRWDVEKGETEE